MSVVYAIRRASDGAVKIGRSVQPQARVQNLSYQHGACEIIFAQPVDPSSASEIEEGAQALAADYWLKDEWFSFPSAELGIDAIKASASRITRGESIDCSAIRKLRYGLGLGDSEAICTPMPQDLVARIDDFRYTGRVPSRAEAVRRLIEAGLTALSEKKPGKPTRSP